MILYQGNEGERERETVTSGPDSGKRKGRRNGALATG